MSKAIYGNILIKGNRELRLEDGDTNYVALKSPAAVGLDVTLTLPDTDGNADEVMSTDGTGALSFIKLSNANIDAAANISAGKLDLKASGGLKDDTNELAVEPADFAGAGLEDDGADNLRIAAAAAGAGLSGGGGSALAVNVDASSIEISTDTLQVKALGITNAMLAGSIASSKLADEATIAFLNQNEAVTGTWTFNTALPTSSLTPSSSNELTTKSYVDNAVSGLSWKDKVRVATTAAGTLATDFENGDTVDGILLATNDRILIKNQTVDSENGIYTVNASGAPTRATDMDSAAEANGAAVFVEQGTVNGDKGFVQTSGVTTIDTDSLTFVQFTGGGALSGGDGIDITGNVVSVDLGTDPGLEFVANQLEAKVDDVTIEKVTAGLQLKDGGITNAKVNAAAAIAESKLSLDQNTADLAQRDFSNLTVASLAAESLLVGSSSTAVAALAAGSEGQVLKIVGGSVSWSTDNSARSSFNANWITADGVTKVITHNLGTKDIIVQIYDNANDQQIEIDAITRTDVNTLTVDASEAPNASGWRVVILDAS